MFGAAGAAFEIAAPAAPNTPGAVITAPGAVIAAGRLCFRKRLQPRRLKQMPKHPTYEVEFHLVVPHESLCLEA